jgi:hypothetical protein
VNAIPGVRDTVARAAAERKAGRFEEAIALFESVAGSGAGDVIFELNFELAKAQQFVQEVLAGHRTVEPKKMNRILGIGVPTYRRHAEIREIAANLCHQICQLDEHVELIFSDNFPGDTNKEYLQEFEKHFPFFKYHKNFFNVEGDMNFYNLYLSGTTEFKYIIGDDDLLLPGGLKAMVDALEANRDEDVNLFCCPALAFDIGITKQLYQIIPSPSDAYEKMSGEAAVRRFGLELLRVSNLIIRRTPIVFELQHLLLGQGIVSLCMALNALAKGNCIALPRPVYAYREGDKTDWSHLWTKIWTYHVPSAFAEACRLGYFPPEAVDEYVFGQHKTSYREWMATHDPGNLRSQISELKARIKGLEKEVESYKEVCRDGYYNQVLETLESGTNGTVDLTKCWHVFGMEVKNADQQGYFYINCEGRPGFYMHPNDPGRPPIECRLQKVPLRRTSALTARVTLDHRAHQRVAFSVCLDPVSAEIGSTATFTVELGPGEEQSWSIPVDVADGLYDLTLSTQTAPGAPNNWHCWSWFEEVLLGTAE